MSKTAVAVVSILVMLCACVCAAQVKGKQRPGAGAGVDVERAKAGTPEVHGYTPEQIPNGKETDVVIRGTYFPGGERKFMADGACKLIKGWAASDSEFHFTVISTREEGGDCYMTARGTGKNVYQIVPVQPTAAVAEKRKRAEQEKAAKEQVEVDKMMEFIKKAPEMVGKKWDAKLPNGQNETWTWVSKTANGGKFKSSAGDEVTVSLIQTGGVIVGFAKNCILSGTLKDDKVLDGQAGAPANLCRAGQGKWTATISR